MTPRCTRVTANEVKKMKHFARETVVERSGCVQTPDSHIAVVSPVVGSVCSGLSFGRLFGDLSASHCQDYLSAPAARAG